MTWISPHAIVDPGAIIGENCKIWHFSHVLKGSVIGDNCNIGQNVVIGPDVAIGRGCKIQDNVLIYKGVTLADDVFCGPGMVFTNVFNPRARLNKMSAARLTSVGKGASLGANCTIVCGVSIGSNAMVGAGAVVTRDVPPHALVYGNPARFGGLVCHCGEKLESDLSCPVCGNAYQKNRGELLLKCNLGNKQVV